MDQQKLKFILDQKFNVLSYTDLAEVNQSHSAVYRLFDLQHKDAYGPTDRIVFYSKYLPSDRLLKHIQNAANLIDISACFIMICGPFDITETLKKISHDTGIEYYPTTVDSDPLLPDQLSIEHTICPIPWSNITVMNDGRAKACCVSKEWIGDATTESLTDMFYNQHMEKLRDSMKNGERHGNCEHCWRVEKHHGISYRQWHLKENSKKFYIEQFDDPKIRTIDFRPSNICNFKCRICNPQFSSLFNNEVAKHTTNPETIKKLKIINERGRWFDNDDTFIKQIVELLPSLSNIDFYGGEPFLLKQLPLMLQQVIKHGYAKNIRLHFNTNGSVFPEKLMPYLAEFKKVQIGFSIDNLYKRFEFERGGSWNEVESNIKKIKSETNFDLSIMPTVNIQNVLYLPELVAWANDMQIEVVFNYLDEPEYFSIDLMTPEAKKLVTDRYIDQTEPELQKIAQRIQNSHGSNGKDFVEYMKKLDQWRNENFSDSHKEIAIAMGYVVQ